MRLARRGAETAPGVALLPWGDVFEDFLDGVGVRFERFCDEMTGGWLFGYAEALQRAGYRPVIVCFLAGATRPERYVHRGTGCSVWALPAARSHLALRGLLRGRRRLRRPVREAVSRAATLLGTPLRPLAQVLRRERCAGIVCQEYEYARFDACVLLGRVLGLPVLATFQGGLPGGGLSRHIRAFTVPRAAALLIGDASEAERVVRSYRLAPDRVVRLPNPLDVAEWRPGDQAEARRELGIPAGARVAAWHGRVDIHRKGLDVLVDAWDEVCAARPGADLRLLLLGSGDDADALRRRIDGAGLRGITWRAEYVLDRQAVRRQLAAADLFVLPSRHEGFAVAPLEAMACGRPVVAADAPGVLDCLGDGESGLVVPRGDAPAMAAALGRLLDDPRTAAALGRLARRRVEDRYSLDRVGVELKALLDAVLGERAQGRSQDEIRGRASGAT
ncbi:MAG TPA: glycosyltransferase family 4 protein [Actinomycetes bacterium]|jgi:starch synthase|nr:glycosyltransferase family 4 protein [Actinomycetes bacterium]